MFTKSDHTRLENWRPITLLTTNYKILTKAPATRHTQVLLSIINSDQTACIPGRTINDNLSLISDATSFAKETQTLLALISIYQLKAFNGVSQPFLVSALQHFGFSPNFHPLDQAYLQFSF